MGGLSSFFWPSVSGVGLFSLFFVNFSYSSCELFLFCAWSFIFIVFLWFVFGLCCTVLMDFFSCFVLYLWVGLLGWCGLSVSRLLYGSSECFVVCFFLFCLLFCLHLLFWALGFQFCRCFVGGVFGPPRLFFCGGFWILCSLYGFFFHYICFIFCLCYCVSRFL